jgi:hypothetical protein
MRETIKGQNQDNQDYRITGIIVVYFDRNENHGNPLIP